MIIGKHAHTHHNLERKEQTILILLSFRSFALITGNIALVQVQATVAAFIVAIFAICVGAAMDGIFEFDHAMLVISSAVFTATSASFVLGKSISS